MAKALSFIQLGNFKAKVTCVCGWESETFGMGPHDPAEALVAYGVEHLICDPPKLPPVVYYAVAREVHGQMRILGELVQGPDAKTKAEEVAKGLAPQGKTMQVVEVKVISSWQG